ncbi:hypothetical protein [Candidatus Symbiopectobacterium sp.]|nr:hypothetical protein [Candidatus Symbiopectobacterium sp.]
MICSDDYPKVLFIQQSHPQYYLINQADSPWVCLPRFLLASSPRCC